MKWNCYYYFYYGPLKLGPIVDLNDAQLRVVIWSKRDEDDDDFYGE